MECKRPAILVGQRCEAGHGRSFQPLRDDLVKPERTALPCPVDIGKVYRRGIKRLHCGRWRTSGGAVTRGAVLREESAGADKVGRLRRGERNRVGCQQRGCQRAREAPNSLGGFLVGDQSSQLVRSADECLIVFSIRQCSDLPRHDIGKLHHFAIFEFVGNTSLGNRGGVVDRDIIEQTPGGSHVGFFRVRGDGQTQRKRQQNEPQCRMDGGGDDAMHEGSLYLLQLIRNSRV